MKEQDSMALVAEVARMYYMDDIPQIEIAKRLFLSRAKVSRLIRKARESKIVEIQIRYPLERSLGLENALKEKFHLKEAIVIVDVEENENSSFIVKRLGEIGAQYIDELLKSGDSIGLSWGKTLYQLVNQLHPTVQKNIQVVQLTGASADGYTSEMDAPNLVRIMKDKYEGTECMLYAPLYVDSDIVRQELRKEPIIRKALQKGLEVNYIVTGIAGIHNKDTWAGYLSEEKKKDLIKKGAVGYMCGHFFDFQGNPIHDDIENKIIGISLEGIRNAAYVIAVAGGVDKAKAIYSALSGGYINCLITDSNIAEKLLRYEFRNE